MFYKNLISIVRSVNRRISGVEFLFVLLSQLESPLSMRSKSEKVKKKFKKNSKKSYFHPKPAEIRHFYFFIFLFFYFIGAQIDSDFIFF